MDAGRERRTRRNLQAEVERLIQDGVPEGPSWTRAVYERRDHHLACGMAPRDAGLLTAREVQTMLDELQAPASVRVAVEDWGSRAARRTGPPRRRVDPAP